MERLKWMLVDLCLALLAFVLAYGLLVYSLRYLPKDVASQQVILIYVKQCLILLGGFGVLRLGFFYLGDLYRGISRFAGVHELRRVILSVTMGSCVLVAWNSTVGLMNWTNLRGEIPAWVPWPVVFSDWLLCMALIGGARLSWRLWNFSKLGRGSRVDNVLIVGAGDMGELVCRNLERNPQLGYRPVGFVDEDESLWGRQIHGHSVLGGLTDLPGLIEKKQAAEVVVAIPKASPRFMSRVVEICEKARVNFKIVPAMSDLMNERVSINQIRPVEIEDLLGREPVDLALADEVNYISDKVVLVTGAGGSIGAELCRQVMLCQPRRLVLLGKGENSIYEIAMELRRKYPEADLQEVIADIQDVDRMDYLFGLYRPQVIFHAAAHKHVPLMELHPAEAVKNNVIGTFNTAFLARENGAERFILISTDKAVRPSSVMGSSKRIAEMIVSAFSHDSPTAFMAVRFGNVLGSRGSVVPLFRRQIAEGGPVTVTHPEMERYFMTIPEAVNLVLQAGALGANGQLFLLDMGEPVKIADLARRMIALSGFEPEVDIDIVFTGTRPGEKIKEELLTRGENLEPTSHPKIFSTLVDKPELKTVKGWLRRLDQLVEEQDGANLRTAMHQIVPEYRVPEEQGAQSSPQGETSRETASS